MRRPIVISTLACALALAPAVVLAQDPPAAPAQPTPPPEPPKVPFETPAGILLVQIKPDQTAVFEEMVTKINAGLAKSQDPLLKEQAAGLKIYKSSEAYLGNTLYVVLADPAVAKADYDLFQILYKTMTDDEKRAPEFKPTWDKYVAAFGAGLSRLSLTPVAK